MFAQHNSGIRNLLLALILMPSVLFALPKTPPIEERVSELKLENGLTVVVAERHNSPVFFTLSTFRVGSCQELPNRSGLAHFLEHMLFKGSKTVGTTKYKAEAPLMDRMEIVAGEVRDQMRELQAWRYDMFEAHALKARAELSPEILDKAALDEGLLWESILEVLPVDPAELPAEWQTTPWIIREGDRDYWSIYRNILKNRAEIARLLAEAKQYISESEPIDGIYDVRGSNDMNAFTTEDQTTYMVGLPSNCLELWMYLESDRFQNPVFREFYSEREVVMEELRNHENDPDNALWYKMIGTAFDAHPYGRPVVGWLGDIRSTLRSDMEGFFWKYYTPNNCQIAIVGDVDTEEVFRLARKYFSKWKAGEPSPAVTIVEPSQSGERRTTIEKDAEPKVLIAYHIPAAPHPDAYALGIAQAILSGGKTSRFYRKIFEEKGLTAGAPGVYDGPADRYPNLFIIEAAPKAPHTTAEIEAAVYEEIERLKSEPVSEWELERTKNRIRVNELNRIGSNQWLAFSLSSSFVQFGDWRTIASEYERKLMVTPDDIQRVIKKYLVPENRTVAMLVKPQTEQADASQIEGAGK